MDCFKSWTVFLQGNMTDFKNDNLELGIIFLCSFMITSPFPPNLLYKYVISKDIKDVSVPSHASSMAPLAFQIKKRFWLWLFNLCIIGHSSLVKPKTCSITFNPPLCREGLLKYLKKPFCCLYHRPHSRSSWNVTESSNHGRSIYIINTNTIHLCYIL